MDHRAERLARGASGQERSEKGQKKASSSSPSGNSPDHTVETAPKAKKARRGGERGPARERGDGLRTCVACGIRAEAGALLRLVTDPEGGVMVDLRRRAEGRGAHVCPTQVCLETAFKRQRVSKALQVAVGSDGVAEVIQLTVTQLQARIHYFLAVCQKAGKIASGADAIQIALTKGHVALLMMASDVSEATRERLEIAARGARVPVFESDLNREALGLLLGKGERAAGAISRGPLAEGLLQDLHLLEQLTARRRFDAESKTKPPKSCAEATGSDPCRELPRKHGKE